jgi:hypothetical protein
MRAIETVSGLAAFTGRGAGTDSERRAASWLAGEASSANREVIVEPFWCRPNWALAQAWHLALAIAGSLVSVASAIAGVAMLGVALVCVIADAVTGISPGRRLTPEHASQNVVAVPVHSSHDRTRLIITANYDAGRVGLIYRDLFRRSSSTLLRAVRGIAPGWLGWVVIVIVWLIVIAVLRLEGHHSQPIGAIQLVPTVVLVLGFAALLELATGDWSPAGGDNATGAATALALARALDTAPPAHLEVELVLTGAGDTAQSGLRRYLRAHPPERGAASTVVVGIASCAGGTPHWWLSDGALLPLRYARPLRDLSARIATDEPHLGLAAHTGRGSGPAFPGRTAGLPAITIGCLDPHELPPRSHRRDDTPHAIDAAAVDAAVQFGLLLIDGIDAAVADSQGQPSATPA